MKFISTSVFDLCAPVNAKEVGEELKKLGQFTPAEIIERAQDKESPLHKYFEWDDSVAAKKYRLSQARHLVLSIGFETESGFTRSFESVVINDRRVYAPISTIANHPELVDQVLKSALNELVFWKAKHQKYKTFFGGVFDEIDKSEEALRRVSEEKARGGKGVKARNTANKKAGRKRDNHRRQPAAS